MRMWGSVQRTVIPMTLDAFDYYTVMSHNEFHTPHNHLYSGYIHSNMPTCEAVSQHTHINTLPYEAVSQCRQLDIHAYEVVRRFVF